MKYFLSCLALFVFGLMVSAQDDLTVIRIKLINGQTGQPMKVQIIALEDRDGYRELSVRPDASGVATLRINRNTTILTHNTHEYVSCADEHGGLIHNDYKVSDIVSRGITEFVAQPISVHPDFGFCESRRIDSFRASLETGPRYVTPEVPKLWGASWSSRPAGFACTLPETLDS